MGTKCGAFPLRPESRGVVSWNELPRIREAEMRLNNEAVGYNIFHVCTRIPFFGDIVPEALVFLMHFESGSTKPAYSKRMLSMRNPVHTEGRSSLVHTPKQLISAIVLSFAALVIPQIAGAQSGERSGKDVVETVCSACHATGAKGSPRIGDEKAWAKLASRGLTSLTASALKGIRNMPSHGGNPSLTDSEIERAITYMVNQSGGHWTEPIARTPDERKGEQIVKAQCSKCHQTGVGGAPKIGDRAAWIPRLKQGFDFLVRSAINGHGAMPPRGGMANLTDAEVRAAITYMVNGGSVPTAKPSSVTSPVAADSNHKVIGGTEIYLGIVSAESIRAQHTKGDPES